MAMKNFFLTIPRPKRAEKGGDAAFQAQYLLNNSSLITRFRRELKELKKESFKREQRNGSVTNKSVNIESGRLAGKFPV